MRPIERLVNVVALLGAAGRPLTAAEIIGSVPGFSDEPEAARRAFERDKEKLRDAGIELEVVEIDAVVGKGPGNVGYRLPPDRGLPDPGFTLAERGALGVAASFVWGEAPELGGAASGDAGDALEGIRPASVGGPAALDELMRAVVERRRVTMEYATGGDDARRRERTVAPYGVKQRRGRWYVVGLDADSGEVRSFRVDRIVGEVRAGGAGGFARPERFRADEAVPERAWLMGAEPGVSAAVAVRPAVLWWAAPEAGVEASPRTVPIRGEDWPVLDMEVRHTDAFLSWVLSLRDDAVVLSPRELREALRDRLRALVDPSARERA